MYRNRVAVLEERSKPPKWPMITFRKLRFSSSFEPFLVLNQPLFKAFWDFPWAKPRQVPVEQQSTQTAKHSRELLVPFVPNTPAYCCNSCLLIRHGANVKVTPLRVHMYSKSKH